MKPLTLSAHEVRAVLDGTKTQHWMPCAWLNNPNSPALSWVVACDEPGWFGDEEGEVQFKTEFSPGDQIWVREAWQISGLNWGKPSPAKGLGKFHYRATDDGAWKEYWGKWRNPQHMPRWASRITLDVTGVRVCRVQDVTDADAIACGAKPVLVPPDGGSWPHYEGFVEEWTTHHGPASWDANDWCAVVDFERRG